MLLQGILRFYERNATSWLRLAASVLFYVVCFAAIFALGSKIETTTGKPAEIPDLQLLYVPGNLRRIFGEMTAGGRNYYGYIELFDYFPYMWSYTNLFGTLAALALRLSGWGQTVPVLRRLPLLSFVTLVADMIENMGLLYMAGTFPNWPEWLAMATGMISTVKFACALVLLLVTVPALLYGTVAWLLGWRRGPRATGTKTKRS